MDNLTHSLFGATLVRTPLGRAGRGATAALVLSSNAPDIDIVAAFGGSLNYLEWHRGPTHGPLGIVGLGLATAAVVWGVGRVLDRRSGEETAERATFGRLAILSTVGVLLHVAMDLPTSYGTRALSPFDWTWYAVDWMPIIEVYLLAALGVCLYFGRTSMMARRRNAAIALSVMALIYAVRATAHDRAIALAPRVFGPILPGRCPGARPQRIIDRWPGTAPALDTMNGRCLLEIAAMPDFMSPIHWRLVARLSNAYEVQRVNVLDAWFRAAPVPTEALWRRSVREPNQWTPAVRHAAASDVARVFLGFSRFPAARSYVDRDGTIMVRWSDMRYVPPGLPRNASRASSGLFSTTVLLAPDGRIVDQRLGP